MEISYHCWTCGNFVIIMLIDVIYYRTVFAAVSVPVDTGYSTPFNFAIHHIYDVFEVYLIF